MHRSTFSYQHGCVTQSQGARAKRSPKTAYTDKMFTEHIRQVITASPFLDQSMAPQSVGTPTGARGSHVQTAGAGGPRQADILAHNWAPCVLRPRVYEGTIRTEHPNQMWSTDATAPSQWRMDPWPSTIARSKAWGFMRRFGPPVLRHWNLSAKKCASSLVRSRQAVRQVCKFSMITVVSI